MAHIVLDVIDADARAFPHGEITASAVGIKVRVNLNGPRWDGLNALLIVSNGKASRKMMIHDGEAELPHELLIAGRKLMLGVDGTNEDGTIRIPTVWATGDITVKQSVASVTPSPADKVTPSLEAQVLAAAKKAEKTASDIQRRVDNHEFDGKDGQPGAPGRDGLDGADGQPGKDGRDGVDGKDYILTDADKQQIADMARYDDSELKEDLTHKVGYSEVVGNQLLMYSDSTKTKLLATLDLPTPDLMDYVKNTDYAGTSKGGIILPSGTFGLGVNSTGNPYALTRTATQYRSANGGTFIGKTTLENVLAAPSIMPALTAEEQLAARQRLGMPGEYELVSVITTDADKTKEVIANLDLRRAIVMLTCPALSSQPANVIISCRYKFAYNKHIIVRNEQAAASNIARYTVFGECYDHYGYWDAGITLWQSYPANPMQVTSYPAQSFNTKFAHLVSDYPAIVEVDIEVSSSSGVIPEGSEIRLFGIRN